MTSRFCFNISIYENFKNFRVIIDDIIYFLNRNLGISTFTKNDIERSIIKLARKIVNQENIKPKFIGDFGVYMIKIHHDWHPIQEKESGLLY